MDKAVTVRPAISSDIGSIVDLWRDLLEYHPQLGPNWAPAPDSAEHFARFLAEQLSTDGVLILIAEVDGKAMGYCQAMIGSRPPIFEQTERCVVLDLVVTEAERKQGVGGGYLTRSRAGLPDAECAASRLAWSAAMNRQSHSTTNTGSRPSANAWRTIWQRM